MLEILVADDEPSIRLTVCDALRARGNHVTSAANGAEALAALGRQTFDLVISDIRMPKADGLEVLRATKHHMPDTEVILMTAYAAVSDAVAAMREGATDYLIKPVELDELVLRVDRIAERRALEEELKAARAELATVERRSPIIGKSPAMTRLLKMIDTIAESDAPVVISGESGTGKELVARRIHQLSSRRDKPFVAVNCAAFPETLLEAELFGHEAGAFTGAVKRRAGRFQAAEGGTLLLDEIAEIPPMAQAKLLRVLQEGAVEPLGTNEATQTNVRLLAATHRNIKERIQDGLFREDLYYRINVLDVTIPPLRERRGDLPLLVEYFLRKFTPAGRDIPSLSPQAWAALSEHSFPGNVRELEHAINRAVVLSRGQEIGVEALPDDIAGTNGIVRLDGEHKIRTLQEATKEFEREYLVRVLNAAEGKKSRAAEFLGISRKNLWEKLKQHGISATVGD
ncbi:MAG: sigma-54-dependent Fis family transcriptional regulator [Deltaproteobacteria bacterium]|nr:sigma-54-dependent Fis family transcriptional regulator [Deltaproteobacteria bacterium]